MKNFLILFILLGYLASCKKIDPTPADQFVGEYSITHYILGKDTLISPALGNTSPLPNPFLIVDKKSDNQIDVRYISDENNRFGGGLIFTFSLLPYENKLLLIAPKSTVDIYSGYARNDTLYMDYFSWDPIKDKTYRAVTIAKRRR